MRYADVRRNAVILRLSTCHCPRCKMPVKPRPWRSYVFTEKEFKERLGIDPRDKNLMLHVYPNRIEVTAEYEPSSVTSASTTVKRVHGDLNSC